MQVQIQSLSSTHNCKEFDCGSQPLDKWLATMASQQQKKNIARTFVLVDVTAPKTILGFYTLAVSEVPHEQFPNSKKFPDRVPVVKLARFAMCKTMQCKGLGTHLLLNALERIVEISNNAGIAAVVVDAKNSGAAGYYQRHGFTPSPDNPLRLFLLTATLREARQSTLGLPASPNPTY